MYRCRTARTLGAAVGGLLGFAFLPLAVAHADNYTISVDPGAADPVVTGLYGTGFGGADTAPPAVAGSIQSTGTFDYTDTTIGDTGTFTGDQSTDTDGFGDTNAEYLVTSSTGTDGPAVGSVFDTYTFGDGEDEDIYSAIPTGDGDYTISDTMVTPFGDYTIPETFDAADVTVADAGGVSIANGDVINPDGSQTVTAINGIPPLTMAFQGTQTFGVDNAAGTSVGSLGVDDTTTADGVGTYTEAVLVTSDSDSTNVGTAAGELPAVGSVFNTADLGGMENIYSDLVGTDGAANVITDTVQTSLGDFTIPTTFNAAAAEDTAAVDLADGDVLDPTGSLDLTGINGLPPVDVGVQGTQTFDLGSGSTDLGTFTADVTNTLGLFGNTTETILVTSSTDTSDLPVGSEIETVSLGTGFENIYTDLATGTTSDTLVTPLGDITMPASFDVVANLAGDILSGS